VPPGQVVVLDNSGRLDATVWGDIMALVARRQRLGYHHLQTRRDGWP
jgi:4-hydroxy-4-methyl-2-oxoglutarate aldolase